MLHPIYKVTSLKIVGNYKLELRFDDNSVKAIDFLPVLYGEIYAPLRDLTLFNQVVLDPEVCTITWPNGADFDPAILHDWEDYVEEFSRCAQEWEFTKSS